MKKKPAGPPPRTEHSAGGVVFRRTPGGMLIGLILDSYRKWTFPKGRVEAGESVPAAAVRETEEEMGVRRLHLVTPLGRTSILFRDRFEQPGTMVHKNISYFLMEAPGNERGKAENKASGERVRAIRWVPFRRAPRTVSYRNMLPIARAAVAYLEKALKPTTKVQNKPVLDSRSNNK